MLAGIQQPPNHLTPQTPLPAAPPPRPDDMSHGSDVEILLKQAGDLARSTAADKGLVRIRDIFGAMIASPNMPAWSVLASSLESAGVFVNLGDLSFPYKEFLDDPKRTYTSFLEERWPYQPRPLSVPSYDADAVLGDDESGSAPGLPDLVGITPEVDA